MNQKKISPQQELNNQLGFEKLIREISTYFINLDMNNFEDGIAHGLHQLAEYTGNDQITIFNIDPDIETAVPQNQQRTTEDDDQLQSSNNLIMFLPTNACRTEQGTVVSNLGKIKGRKEAAQILMRLMQRDA